MRALFVCLLFTLCGSAEIRLFVTGITVNQQPWAAPPQTPLSVADFPDIRENDMADLTFELRNAGNTDISITNLRLFPKTDVCGSGGGVAFNLMTSTQTPPGILRANGSYSFQVRYLPPKPQCYEAVLAVAQQTFVLRGSARGRTVMFEIDTLGQRQIINGSTSEFGSVRIGEAYTKSYRITNNTGQSVMIAPPVIAGEAGVYGLLEAPESTRTVLDNGVYEFKVRFSPNRTGLLTASLTVDGRTIQLAGTGLPGIVPNFTLQAPSGMLDSNTQAEAQIQIGSAATTELTGTLELRFEKDSNLPDDSTIRFIDNGARTLAFRIPVGATRAQFGTGTVTVARFQTGTASGKIRLVAVMAPWEQSALLDIRADAPRWSDSSLQRGAGSLSVNLTGFDNTRSASSIEFRFFDGNNQAVGDTGGIQAAVSDLFSAFFGASNRGGQFTLRAQFPVEGDALAIRRVEVILRNRLGPSLVRVVE